MTAEAASDGAMVWRNLIVEAPARKLAEPLKADVIECQEARDCGERGDPELGHFACVAQRCVEVEPAAAPYFSEQGLGVAGVETVPARAL